MNKNKIIRWIVTQKFRFDIAITFVSIINFFLLVITASDKIIEYFALIGILVDDKIIIIFGSIFVFGGMWLFGYLLDTRMKYFDTLEDIRGNKNPVLVEILDNTKKILEK